MSTSIGLVVSGQFRQALFATFHSTTQEGEIVIQLGESQTHLVSIVFLLKSDIPLAFLASASVEPDFNFIF